MTIFHAINPATGATLEPAFTESSVDDVARALVRANAAFDDYRARAASERANFLRAIAREIDSAADVLTPTAHAETALPIARLDGERTRTVNQLRLIADAVDDGTWLEARIDRADPARTPAPRPDLRRMLIPIGPVAVFGASNFPLAFGAAGNDTASALGAGCTVVYKAHPAQPGTSTLVAQAIARAVVATGMPEGVFSMLHGWSNDVGMAMVQHPLTRAVGFTGSLRGGRALFDAAAARPDPIPVYAEMGSVNPVFVFPSAMAAGSEQLAQILAQSITLGVGQFCTNPGVIVAPAAQGGDALRRQLAEKLEGIAPGVPLYARLAGSYRDGIAHARAAGASTESAREVADRMPPTLLSTDVETFSHHDEVRQEIFGPASVFVTAGAVGDFDRIVDAMEGQLTATIFANDEELTAHAGFVARLERKVGRIILNGVPTGVEVSPAMQHGGPYPASTDERSTSVGTASLSRFARPVCYQGFPDAALPTALRDANPLGIWRLVDGQLTREAL